MSTTVQVELSMRKNRSKTLNKKVRDLYRLKLFYTVKKIFKRSFVSSLDGPLGGRLTLKTIFRDEYELIYN